MGSSAVKFRGKGFWCRDWALELWLYMLVEEINRLSSVEPWLADLRDHWYIQSQGIGSGIIWVGFDDDMTPDQVKQLIDLNKKTMLTVQAFGDVIPIAYLNETRPSGDYVDDLPTEDFVQVGKYFDGLLNESLVVNTDYGPYGRTIPTSLDNANNL